ncbi:UDP-glucuronosyltransferase [Virgibacillus dakarensis]|nr:UDP-glucuronosyltransferase [Virgibacillus dakarensis]MTW86360.1 UDP-glucuronosyltransferase [Virgibacillus dakarensis]
MSQAVKALFLPFMQLPTGHHHVADALIQELAKCERNMNCDKVDILSYSYGKMERVVSSSYLTWIKLFPNVYNRLYQHVAYNKSQQTGHYFLYEGLFSHFLRRLINEKDPAIIFCTHALPSYIASRLKRKKQLNKMIINVYTDFFVNRVWGLEEIDYHFVPTVHVKKFLMERGVSKERIFITGIPVHPAVTRQGKQRPLSDKRAVLVTGGSLGVGAIGQILASSANVNRIHYHVLCGKNDSLYKQLLRQNRPNVTPYSYITSKDEMNDLYDKVDAVVTKPGGVTISESLQKYKPIFIYNPLPGQEQINARLLEKQGLIISSTINELERGLNLFFSDKRKQEIHRRNMNEYHDNLMKEPIYQIIDKCLQAELFKKH